LTILSIYWALAQVFATLVAWPLLGNLTCQQTETTCTRGENMGWRYFMIVSTKEHTWGIYANPFSRSWGVLR
jgi:hypothetical protein